MGEPRPLIETDARDPLAALVRHAAGLRVEYDVTAGAARHEQLAARLEAPVAGPAAASKAWTGWGLASIVAIAAVVAGLAGEPGRGGSEREEAVRVAANDRSGAPASVGLVDTSRAQAEPRMPEEPREHAVPEAAAGGVSKPGVTDDVERAAEAPTRTRSGARSKPAASERSTASMRAPAADDDRIEREAAQIRTIRAALARHDADAALELCDEGDREHPAGVFQAERQGLRVLALVELGRLDAARPFAARYLAAHPSGSLAPRIRRAIEPEGMER